MDLITEEKILKFLQSYSAKFHAKYVGETIAIRGVNSILNAKDGELAYAKSHIPDDVIDSSTAGIVIVEHGRNVDRNNILFCNKPEFAFAIIYQNFFSNTTGNINESALISDEAEIRDNCEIGANVWIGPRVEIGDNVVIAHGTVIGSKGFGYARGFENELRLLPHEGKLILKSDVEIGSNSVIDTASFSETVINQGTKIDNLVHIAHNVSIGENTLIAACSQIAGSAYVGDNCFIHPCASIGKKVKVNNRCIVGSNATVLRDLPDDSKAVGCPAKIIN
jgi:UDP-3-O-[3-hydroxymyristoyl] glucosamine N-acyltransferase